VASYSKDDVWQAGFLEGTSISKTSLLTIIRN
jgi:hypothetical protein